MLDTQPTAVPRDTWVTHPLGRLFVRTWEPPAARLPAAPIVLFHDSLGCVELWRSFPARLSEQTGRRVIAYDRLGFGKSDPHPGRLALDFVDDEAAIVLPVLQEQLGFERFVAFGHSVGGGMAVHCAARHARTCEALVTESAQAFVEGRTTRGIRDAEVLFTDADQRSRLERYHGDKTSWVLDAWIRTWLDPAFATWSLRPVLPLVTSPMLVLHGGLDEYGSTAHPRLIADLAGGPSRLAILDGVHHVPHREVEARVVDLVSQFLQDCAGPATPGSARRGAGERVDPNTLR